MPDLLDGQAAEVWDSGATSTSATAALVRTGNPRSSRWRHQKRLRLTQLNSFRKRLARGTSSLHDHRNSRLLYPTAVHSESHVAKESHMGARAKLNAAALNTALAIAILIAIFSGNILAGAVVGGAVVVIQVVSGDIRPSRRR